MSFPPPLNSSATCDLQVHIPKVLSTSGETALKIQRIIYAYLPDTGGSQALQTLRQVPIYGSCVTIPIDRRGCYFFSQPLKVSASASEFQNPETNHFRYCLTNNKKPITAWENLINQDTPNILDKELENNISKFEIKPDVKDPSKICVTHQLITKSTGDDTVPFLPYFPIDKTLLKKPQPLLHIQFKVTKDISKSGNSLAVFERIILGEKKFTAETMTIDLRKGEVTHSFPIGALNASSQLNYYMIRKDPETDKMKRQVDTCSLRLSNEEVLTLTHETITSCERSLIITIQAADKVFGTVGNLSPSTIETHKDPHFLTTLDSPERHTSRPPFDPMEPD